MSVTVTNDGPVRIVSLDRPDVRNAVDGAHAKALYDAFRSFDGDDSAAVAVLHGAGGVFCAGADLGAVSRGEMLLPGPPGEDDRGPMGPTRLRLSKPVIAAVDGYAVAGGIELALWCDLRVVDPGATLGVFCRRWGVPLVDGGTVRLPRVVGFGVAMDLILTGRAVGADEALRIGLANRVSAPGAALAEAVSLAHELAALPQLCLRNDRLSSYEQQGLGLDEAMAAEWAHGLVSLQDAAAGASRFAAGEGRHGSTV
ncbi:MAG: enoyl-CoA hydratase/isomerase [Frankiales bacterium]|nr:enoyl-CoA hydratase/isomerase [Frankiales bacterium]